MEDRKDTCQVRPLSYGVSAVDPGPARWFRWSSRAREICYDRESMREHEFTIELPASAARLWALFQRYDLWKEYAPAVLDVEIVYPGDADGNGLLRKVVYPLPFGRRGESFELVKNVQPGRGYDYVMLRSGLSGSVALEPQGPNRTRLRFRERFHMRTPVLRWFEGPIYRFINKKNEESMRGAAAWLERNPGFRADLVE